MWPCLIVKNDFLRVLTDHALSLKLYKNVSSTFLGKKCMSFNTFMSKIVHRNAHLWGFYTKNFQKVCSPAVAYFFRVIFISRNRVKIFFLKNFCSPAQLKFSRIFDKFSLKVHFSHFFVKKTGFSDKNR